MTDTQIIAWLMANAAAIGLILVACSVLSVMALVTLVLWEVMG